VIPTTDLRVGLPAIKDQGRRGTCVACAATAAHEVIRAEGVDLSVEFLHWASKRRDALPVHSEGTTLTAAKDALDQDGQPPEERWPYDDTRDQWAATYRPPTAAMDQAERRRLNGGELIQPTATAVRDALDRGRPVVIGVRLYATWYGVGSDGVIALPTAGSLDFGGHAVLVVGYRGDDLIVQNSWGSDWGEGGSAYLPSVYLDRYAVAAWSLAR
jgi:C1A family cysteine protease